MGKGRIVSVGPGAAQYDIDVVRDVTYINNRITKLTEEITALDTKIAIEETTVTEKSAEMAAALTALNNAIATGNETTVKDTTKTYRAAASAYVVAVRTLSRHKLEWLEKQKEKESLEAIPETVRHTGVWCVDYTADLSVGKEVGTIEMNGEDSHILIRPGGPSFSKTMGQLQPVMGGPASQAAWNWAMFPGWQKWKPTYRVGTITSLDKTNDKCNVALSAAASIAQSLDINAADNLASVPIDYMDSDAESFIVGDEVVVEFTGQSNNSPKVIGFVENPRMPGWIFTFSGPYAPATKPSVLCYYLHPDGTLQDVACTTVFSSGTLIVSPLYTSYGTPISKETPIYVKIESYFCCKQTFSSYAEYVANGSLPVGKYVFHMWGSTTSIISTNVAPWDRGFADMPWSASYSFSISTYGPYDTPVYIGSFQAAGFDVDNSHGWVLPLTVGVDPGEISFGGFISDEPGFASLKVTFGESINVTKWTQPLISESGVFEEGGEYAWLKTALEAGGPIYLPTNGSFYVRWFKSSGSLSYTADVGPGSSPVSIVRAGGDVTGSAVITNPYYVNTYVGI